MKKAYNSAKMEIIIMSITGHTLIGSAPHIKVDPTKSGNADQMDAQRGYFEEDDEDDY